MTIVDARLQTTSTLERRPTWHSAAACLGLPDMFFPTVGASAQKIATAKQVCRSCPVLDDCYEWVMSNPPEMTLYGIWAGMTERERRAARKEYRKTHRTLPPVRAFPKGTCQMCGRGIPKGADRKTCTKSCHRRLLSARQVALALSEPTERACVQCGAIFVAVHPSNKICSVECRRVRLREQTKASKARVRSGVTRSYRRAS